MNLVNHGKTKDVYVLENGNYLLKFKDDVTGVGGKFDPGANQVGLSIEGMGNLGLRLTKFFFDTLKKYNVYTHMVNVNLDENLNLLAFAYRVYEITITNNIVSIRNYDFSVSRQSGNKNIGEYFVYLRHAQTYKRWETPCRKFRHGNPAACEYAVAQRVLFSKILIYFNGYRHIGIDYVVYVHGIFNKSKLIHVFKLYDIVVLRNKKE